MSHTTLYITDGNAATGYREGKSTGKGSARRTRTPMQ
jgi:hypothetical protein